MDRLLAHVSQSMYSDHRCERGLSGPETLQLSDKYVTVNQRYQDSMAEGQGDLPTESALSLITVKDTHKYTALSIRRRKGLERTCFTTPAGLTGDVQLYLSIQRPFT